MISKVNPYGNIILTNDYFSSLVAQAARHCYGVAAMGQNPAGSTVRMMLKTGSLPEKGVSVKECDGGLAIELHIMVGYGLNITTITQSITHRVQEDVERATGLRVRRVDVFVDDIISA